MATQRGDGLDPNRPLERLAPSSAGVMQWKPISDLSDADVALAWHRRLVLWNWCEGPHHLTDPADWGYLDADDVRRSSMWTNFLILPEGPG